MRGRPLPCDLHQDAAAKELPAIELAKGASGVTLALKLDEGNALVRRYVNSHKGSIAAELVGEV